MLFNFEKIPQEAQNMNNIVFQKNSVLVSNIREASHAEVTLAVAIKYYGTSLS